MAMWPPSPTVEDEATSLAKEQGLNNVTTKLTDEHIVPSRGSPDQMPVIIDTDVKTSAPPKENSNVLKGNTDTKGTGRPGSSPTFRGETGLPTPPSSDSETRGRSRRPSNAKKDKDETTLTPRSKSATGRLNVEQSRPSVSRIQTDVSGELEKMKAGIRRPPSPYAYTREAGTFKVDPSARYSNPTFASSVHMSESPASTQTASTPHEAQFQHQDYESPTAEDRKPKKSLRFAEIHQGSANSSPAPKVSYNTESVPDEIPTQPQLYQRENLPEPPRSRRPDDRDRNESSREVPRKANRSRSRPSRSSSKSRESPHSSSAEDSTASERARSTRKSGSDEHSVQHRPSHRRERPRFEEPLSHQIFTHSKLGPSDDDASARIYRVRDGRNPMTPPTVTTPQHFDDYFSKAFHDNALKSSRYNNRSSADESAVFSPPSSPPRTPRSERPSRQEYFASPSSSPHRLSHHSRGPSFEDNQFKDSKTHNSLLSQATSTAAALATKTSPPVSRSASNAIETTFACSQNALPSKPRSRASSPQRERILRSDTFTYGDQAMPRVSLPATPQSRRPSTRDGLPKIEFSTTPSHALPLRNASWTSHDPQYVVHTAQFGGPTHSMISTNTALPTAGLNAVPQIHRSHSASTAQDLVLRTGEFTLLPCPRSQPIQGLRDWSGLRDIPDLEICPKCAHALALTRYRTLIVQSSGKAYDKPIICAFSRPWIRTAFTQCVKLNKPDLTMVKKASVLPSGARACEGSRPDVRMWWKLVDPATERAVPDFFACSACIGLVHQVFPDLPDQFSRDVLNLEKVCSLHQGSKHFHTLVQQLDQISDKCRDRHKSSPRYMQPFVDHIRRITRHPECARDTFLANRAWHFMNNLPEFTVCDACYEEVVWPQREKPVAKEISKTTQIVPQSAFKGPKTAKILKSGVGTHPTSCQLYSDRMRRIFGDAVAGRISYETFEAKVKERQSAQYRLTEMNRLYEEDQRAGWDRRADIEKNKAYWKSLE